VKVVGVFVTKVARSGTPNELVSYFHLDGSSIAKRVRELLNWYANKIIIINHNDKDYNYSINPSLIETISLLS